MAKLELGTKRLCAGCGAKYYDLNKTPITCPKCGTVFEIVAVAPRGRPDARSSTREAEAVIPETQEAEFVSLEEADAEAKGAKKPISDEVMIDDDDVEIDDEDDSTFIEETEEEDTDVSEIIGGDIENDEES